MSSERDTGAVGITLRYWAGARVAAGADAEAYAGQTVGDVLTQASTRHTALEPVFAVSSILLDGSPAARHDPLTEGATLEVLPPFAGG
jgi:molybdopterin synthase sulfur carrier subunit